MISLIFIPILFWIYAKPTYDRLNLRAINFGLPYKIKKGEQMSLDSMIPIKDYQYKTVIVPKSFDKTAEQSYLALIEKNKTQNIDKTGIKFQLSDDNSYTDLVKLIDIMEKTNQDRYGLDTGSTNAFYYIYKTENNPHIAPICGNIAEYSKRGKEYS